MPGLPDTFAGSVLDFITNRSSLGSVEIAITTGVLTVSADHGLSVNDPVQLGALTGAPAPLVAGTIYYVQSAPTSTTLTLSATVGGALIEPTSSGTSASINRASYFALLKADPGVDPVMASLPEITDPGYGRQVATFALPALSPRGTSSLPLVIFGPFPSGMSTGALYLALVDVVTGTTGKVRYVWILESMLLAVTGESIQLPPGSTTLGW